MEAQIGWRVWIGIAGFIVSVVALLIAIPPFMKMFLGRPRIRITFEDGEYGGHRFAEGVVMNEPTDSWIAKVLGIKTDGVPDLSIIFTIKDDIERTIAPVRQVGIIRPGFHDSKAALHVHLPASRLANARFMVAFQSDNGEIRVVGQDGHEAEILPAGQFQVTVVVSTEIKAYRSSRMLTVLGGTPHQLYWN